MSAPSRRKVKPAPKGRVTFTIVVEAQEMLVEYTLAKRGYMSGLGQFIFRSPHKPARRIPVSETGYRSHFARMEDVEACDSPQVYARDFVLAQIRRSIVRDDDHQLPLF
jgi:hypothetical protein